MITLNYPDACVYVNTYCTRFEINFSLILFPALTVLLREGINITRAQTGGLRDSYTVCIGVGECGSV